MGIASNKNYAEYPFRDLSPDDLPGEQWEDIPGMDGYYCVSNYGRVWAWARPVESKSGQFYSTKEGMRSQSLARYYNSYTKDHTEQLRVGLRYNGSKHTYLVNRLVYQLFVADIDIDKDGLLVVHKDGDNCNNHVDNLMLMNGTELYVHGLRINRRPKSGLKIQRGKNIQWADQNRPRPVVQYALNGKLVQKYGSIGEAAKITGFHRTSIRHSVMKKVIQVNNFVFRFEGDKYKGEHADFSYEKKVTQYSLEGKIIAHYPSLKAAGDATGIDYNTISKSALRRKRTGSGFVWRFEGEKYNGEYAGLIKNQQKAVVQYSLNGKQLNKFPSMLQAATALNCSAAVIADCANKKTKVSKGYVWRFEGDRYDGGYKQSGRGKPVAQYSLQKELIAVYATIEAGAKVTGLTAANIQKNVQGHNHTAGGFVWKHANQSQQRQLTRDFLSQQSLEQTPVYSPEPKKYIVPSKTVHQYDLSGNKIQSFKSTKEAERKTGVHSTSISAVARGKFQTTGGFIWRYGKGQSKLNIDRYFATVKKRLQESSIAVEQFTLEGKRIASYPSIQAAARAEGISGKNISEALKGGQNTAGGFVWKNKK